MREPIVKVVLILILTLLASGKLLAEKPTVGKTDRLGLPIVQGPLMGGYYDGVHIVSDSIGVIANGPTTISNSVIEAPVCVQSSGNGLRLSNNTLICELCVEFVGRALYQNILMYNQCSGRLTNRPDQFGG